MWGHVEAVEAEDMLSDPTSTQRLTPLPDPTQCWLTLVQKSAKPKTTSSKLQDNFEGLNAKK